MHQKMFLAPVAAMLVAPFLVPLLAMPIAPASAGVGPVSCPAPQATLKDTFKNDFLIGAALNQRIFTEEDARGDALVRAQFNCISPENALKWGSVHPQPDTYNFDMADRYVEFGEKNHMVIIGHNLVWHHQTPDWVFQDGKGGPASRDVLLARMRDHIHTVVGRYKGRIKGWDVVNEALSNDGTLRQSPWFKIIGEDYIDKAFEFAHEADPSAELYYNDYSMEGAAKRRGAIKLINRLKAAGIHITAVGLQGHSTLDLPSRDEEDATITDFAKLGIKVMITELDIDVLPGASEFRGADINTRIELSDKVNPYRSGLSEVVQRDLALRYAALFRVFLKHRDVITRVTFWGVTDRDSWLNGWPIPGRTNYPLLFDRNYKPKLAFDAVIQTAE
ncbi:MAG TPA: endo-1,4-beta-xylanase [Blastocatellia bacterium]